MILLLKESSIALIAPTPMFMLSSEDSWMHLIFCIQLIETKKTPFYCLGENKLPDE